MKYICLIFAIIFAILIIYCSGGEMEQKKINYKSLNDIPDATWEKLAQKTIFFGHQSVGSNIIDGIYDLMKENPRIRLTLVEISNPDEYRNSCFLHSKIGENRNPKSKINHFSNMLEKMGMIDIAFVKFCYVDFGRDVDFTETATAYNKSIEMLDVRYPETRFVHFTVPLETSRIPFSFWFKIFKSAGWSYKWKMLTRLKDIWRYDANIKRNEYNSWLRNEYQGRSPIFDLARIQSTRPDGSRVTFEKKGVTYYALNPEYTYDGGHLNELGRKIVAEHLLLFLANLIQ